MCAKRTKQPLLWSVHHKQLRGDQRKDLSQLLMVLNVITCGNIFVLQNHNLHFLALRFTLFYNNKKLRKVIPSVVFSDFKIVYSKCTTNQDESSLQDNSKYDDDVVLNNNS